MEENLQQNKKNSYYFSNNYKKTTNKILIVLLKNRTKKHCELLTIFDKKFHLDHKLRFFNFVFLRLNNIVNK
ncbi:hypothetical protein BHM09_12755 [Salmonella enterica]|uniref:Uncharacterized protein n=1 Tax=Salmonella enterica subsp. arizonae TaxID=59203 RepID=A0A379SVQ7_SALER|nr:hypothetical protein [Salmonella enterica]SUG33025.1 Uncharacterised protein [Salmonella enterica subsp. arizonae]